MGQILVAKKAEYLNADKTEVVPEGSVEAAWLLVGKGSPIEKAVAEHYGIETEEANAVSKMPVDEAERRKAMASPGTTPHTRNNYETMRVREMVTEAVNSNVTKKDNPSGGAQAALMAEGLVNKITGNVGDNYKPGKVSGAGEYVDPIKTDEETADATESLSRRTKVIGTPANQYERKLQDGFNSEAPGDEIPGQTVTEKKDALEKALNEAPGAQSSEGEGSGAAETK